MFFTPGEKGLILFREGDAPPYKQARFGAKNRDKDTHYLTALLEENTHSVTRLTQPKRGFIARRVLIPRRESQRGA